jgi:hypothetical protein
MRNTNSQAMHVSTALVLALSPFLSPRHCSVAAVAQPHELTIQGDRFLLDGKPPQIITGERDHPRIFASPGATACAKRAPQV